MSEELFRQGVMSIEDARFVRDHFIPIAIAEERWNIAVYEVERAIELRLRGMICLLGHKPAEDHNLRSHIAFLCDHLVDTNTLLMPFVIGAYAANGNCIGVRMNNDRIELIKRINKTYTSIGSYGVEKLLSNNTAEVKLEVENNVTRVYYNDKAILVNPTGREPLGISATIRKSVSLSPDVATVRRLKKIGDHLYKKRSAAYYSEQSYTQKDALDAVSNMDEAFEAAKIFFLIE